MNFTNVSIKIFLNLIYYAIFTFYKFLENFISLSYTCNKNYHETKIIKNYNKSIYKNNTFITNV